MFLEGFGDSVRQFVIKYLAVDIFTLLVHVGCGLVIVAVATFWL